VFDEPTQALGTQTINGVGVKQEEEDDEQLPIVKKKEEEDDNLVLIDQEETHHSGGGSDNEAENHYEDDGFVVDALSDEEEAPKKKKLSRLKKGKKSRKRHRGLDEADYELINENLGISVTRPTKQQKRAERRASAPRAADDEIENRPAPSRGLDDDDLDIDSDILRT